jgi:small multidrug resistance pump
MYSKALYFLYLGLGIIAETIATSCLPYTREFTRLWPSVLVLLLYVAGLFFLTLSLRIIPIGIAYAIWAGAGIALVALLSFLLHKQKLDVFAVAGILLIMAGVIVINLFSKSIKHS